jgi:DNA modification methylase
MPAARILIGDVRTRLNDIPDSSIQACITSPPYWGLRDYGTATWEGGDSSCDHLGKPMATKANINRNCGTGNDVKNATAREFYKETCGKCGARRIDSQIGLEQTPDEYVAEMVAVFREVRRVLKDDGVLWLNLGDSYATVSGGMEQLRKLASDTPNYGAIKYSDGYAGVKQSGKKTAQKLSGLKHKDLVGIPWRVAFALQADGWWLRQDIIWHKPNPMPESVTDRCTKSHEYLFMLTKSAKYYFNNQAIQEDAKTPPGATWAERKAAGATAGNVIVGDAKRNGTQRVVHGKGVTSNLTRQDGKRNRRSVWTIPTKPFRGAHFAVMPEALVEPCILASSRQDDTILDPFTGSGTVAIVSLRHGRNYIGTELNPDYVDIAKQRITDDNPMFNELTIE